MFLYLNILKEQYWGFKMENNVFFVCQNTKELKGAFERMLGMEVKDEEMFNRFLESIEREIRLHIKKEIDYLIDSKRGNSKGRYIFMYCEKLGRNVPFLVYENGKALNIITNEEVNYY